MDTPIDLAERIRRACIQAAVEGYERASTDGLCHEGAWESAIAAMQMLDLATLVQHWHDTSVGNDRV